uniref:(northern house mosquito) hypothetical protein n=1 Tax=Culex pipiens TaxID=7175 RepID=A0A8D8IUH1_CULPI
MARTGLFSGSESKETVPVPRQSRRLLLSRKRTAAGISFRAPRTLFSDPAKKRHYRSPHMALFRQLFFRFLFKKPQHVPRTGTWSTPCSRFHEEPNEFAERTCTR